MRARGARGRRSRPWSSPRTRATASRPSPTQPRRAPSAPRSRRARTSRRPHRPSGIRVAAWMAPSRVVCRARALDADPRGGASQIDNWYAPRRGGLARPMRAGRAARSILRAGGRLIRALDVGTLEEGDEPLAKLGRQGRLTKPLGGVDRALVGVHEGHAGRAALDVPFEELGLFPGQEAVHVIGQQVHALGAADVLGFAHSVPRRRGSPVRTLTQTTPTRSHRNFRSWSIRPGTEL